MNDMAHSHRLDGRHALVCGASAGIGRAGALALATAGARVTCLARNREALESLMPKLRQVGAPAAGYIAVDHDDRPALRDAITGLLRADGSVHILINNSGGPPPGDILDADELAFLRAFGRHVLVNHLLVQLALPGMAAAGYGRIINVVSTSVREPLPGLGVSNTVRAAVAAWAKSVSRELPPGVTINNVLPGYTDTGRLRSLRDRVAEQSGRTPAQVLEAWQAQIPEGRIGHPDELGAVIAFLASPAAGYVRGTSIPVDGGRLSSL